MHRLADHNEDYAPFQIDWVGVQAKQLQREGSLCGCPEPPGNWRNPLLWLQVPRRFWVFQGIFEGILALHESTFESLGVTFAQKNHRLRDPDQAEEEPSSYIHLLFEK